MILIVILTDGLIFMLQVIGGWRTWRRTRAGAADSEEMLAGVQLAAASLLLLLLTAATAGDTCGGLLTARHGVVHTPEFPRMFDVPISCRWVIDSSAIPEDTIIVIYLTQLFVTTGLTFTEYTYYEPDSSFQLNPKLIYEVSNKQENSLKRVEQKCFFSSSEMDIVENVPFPMSKIVLKFQAEKKILQPPQLI